MRHMREKILAYVEGLDDVAVGRQTIFRKKQSKSDLETAAWKLDHKLRAVSYHAENLTSLVDSARARLRSGRPTTMPKGATATSEVVLRDDRVPFEIEAFFGAGRSALDYFAQIVSRYVRGRDFSSMRKLGEFAVKSKNTAALWTYLALQWGDWLAAFIDYRDDLIHYVVSKTAASRTWSSKPSPAFTQAENRIRVGTRELLFPVPRKLNRAIEISRWDILGCHPGMDGHETAISDGVIQTKVWGTAVVDGSLVEEWKDAGYIVQEGYVSAEQFIEELKVNLCNLVETTLSMLTENGFIHIPYETANSGTVTPGDPDSE